MGFLQGLAAQTKIFSYFLLVGSDCSSADRSEKLSMFADDTLLLHTGIYVLIPGTPVYMLIFI